MLWRRRAGGLLRALREVRVLRRAEVRPGVWLPLADTETVWREFHDRMRGFVARRVRNDADVDDVVQKVFLRIHRTVGSVRSRERLDAWVYQVARNVIIDHYRSPARRREVPAGDALDLETLPRAASEAEGLDAAESECPSLCVAPMVDRLPEPYRRAIRLVELEGRTQVDAARTEGLSFSGMKTRVQRGRARLKRMLADCCAIAVSARGGVIGCEATGRSGTACAERRSSPAGAPARRST